MTTLTTMTTAQLFTEARSHNGWLDKAVPDDLLHQIYALMKFGPTAANSCPARIVFVKTPEQKEKLVACMSEGNVKKVRQAPVTAIIAMDMRFYEKLHFLFPHAPDARSWYEGNEKSIQENAMRNSSLQGAYLMMAARSLGLDCGPMGGFDADKINATFFADSADFSGSEVKVNFVCSLGYGDASKIFPRLPRFAFDEVCKIV